MGQKRICPRCGRITDEFIGPLCKDCYVKEYGIAIIPKEVTFVFCPHCGSYKYQGKWNPGLNTLENTLREYLFIMLTNKIKPTTYIEEAWIENITLPTEIKTKNGNIKASIKIGGKSGNVLVYEEKLVDIKLLPTICPKCLAKRSKTSFEAIVQIRGSSGHLNEMLRDSIRRFIKEEVESKLRDSIVEIKDLKEGFDLTIYDQVSARIIASKLKKAFLAKVVESHKLVGRRPDGKRKSRITISVRIPDLEPGDILIIDNKIPFLFVERKSKGKGMQFINMETGKETILSSEEIWKHNFRKYKGEERVGITTKRLLLISKNRFKTMFLDVDKNYQDYLEYPTSSIYHPFGDIKEGQEYIAYIYKDKVYITERMS